MFNTMDRYIARQFFINLGILFTAFCTLYITLDLLINLDEFVEAGQGAGDKSVIGVTLGTLGAVLDFYGPLTLLIFSYLGGLLCVAAMGFTVASMIRNRELIALLAGGVSLFRIGRTFMILCLIVNVAIIVDQEVILPGLAHKLVRSQAQVQMETKTYNDIRFIPDSEGTLFTTNDFDPASQTITNLWIHERRSDGPGEPVRIRKRIHAERASWNESQQGWQLINAVESERASIADTEGGLTEQTTRTTFYETDLDPTTLVSVRNATFRGLLNMRDLIRLTDKHRIVDTSEIVKIMHMRVTLPLLNLLVMLMGLHYFLIREPKNLLKQSLMALITCVGAWIGGFLTMQSNFVPVSGLQSAPILLAWLPIAINIPIAYYLYNTIES